MSLEMHQIILITFCSDILLLLKNTARRKSQEYKRELKDKEVTLRGKKGKLNKTQDVKLTQKLTLKNVRKSRNNVLFIVLRASIYRTVFILKFSNGVL